MTHLKFLAILAAVFVAAPAGASAATYSVSPSGSDSATGSSTSPFRTISRAAQVAQAGDTVYVLPGRYDETVPLTSANSGATFRGVGTTRPVIDGGGVRARGFNNNGASQITIENFELTGQTEAGIFTAGSNNEIVANVIHHVGSPSVTHSQGVRVNRGTGNRVAGNTIHHIGPGSQSMGIWLLESRDGVIQDNTVYLVRKEGMRDWKGLDNTLRGNKSYLNWAGIALNTSTGSSVVDNLVYENTQGIVVKHASYSTVLNYWGLTLGRWTKVIHNTVFRSTEASLWIAQSDQPLDLLEARENAFSGAGMAFLRDVPSLRTNVIVDANSYSNVGGVPQWLYKAGYSSTGGLTTWDEVRSTLGWELTAPPADAGSRGVAVPEPKWTPYIMNAVDSSSKGTYYTTTHLNKTSDNNQNTYWLTATNSNEYVTFDFGQQRTFNHLQLTLYSHDDNRNPRRLKFDVSDDGVNWRTVHEATNVDNSGAALYFELGSDVTARYLRYTLVETFCSADGSCGEYFVMSDLEAGLLGSQAVPVPAEYTTVPAGTEPTPTEPTPDPEPTDPEPTDPTTEPEPEPTKPGNGNGNGGGGGGGKGGGKKK